MGQHLFNHLKKDNEIIGIGRKDSCIGEVKIYGINNVEKLHYKPDVMIMCHASVSGGNVEQPLEALFQSNVLTTDKLIGRFNPCKIIYISSVAVYSNTNTIDENTLPSPYTNYGLSKYWGERIVLASQGVAIRFPSLFGKYMKENTLIPNYVNQALRNKEVEVWGTGCRPQNYLPVEEACNFIESVMRNYKLFKGKAILGTVFKEYSNLQIAQIIAESTQSFIKFIKEDNTKGKTYNNKKILDLIKYKPQSDIVAQLKKYIQWKKNELELPELEEM